MQRVITLTPEQRSQCEQATTDRFWVALPELMDGIIEMAQNAQRPVTNRGDVVTWVPDHYMRLQAWDRIAQLTIRPKLEKAEMQTPVIVYNAIQGVYAERLMEALRRPENAAIQIGGNMMVGDRIQRALRGDNDA